MLRRLPIRIKLTLAFAGVMAAVLAATGAFVYFRLDSDLTHSVDQGLRARAVAVGPLVERAGRDEGLVEIVAADGRVLKAANAMERRGVLSRRQLRAALSRSIVFERRSPLGDDEHWRVLARPVRTAGGTQVAVLAAPLQTRGEALRDLTIELLLGGAAALALASLGGYALAAAALRPVEAMGRKAAAISMVGADQRLPVPDTNDEISKLGERLNEMLARIESALGHERRFLADASHELRTPLAILKTELDLALRRRRSADELEAVLASAAEETDRLAQLAEDLLLVARAAQGELPVRCSTSPAGELLDGVARQFALRGVEAGRTIETRAPEQLQLVCDPVRVRQALSNLVDNALRHGGGSIELAAREHNGVVELHVLDDGLGFPPSFLPHAFERFSRADGARTGAGAGLGLSIVDAIARAHGGTAGLRNRAGGGSDVWLSLPR